MTKPAMEKPEGTEPAKPSPPSSRPRRRIREWLLNLLLAAGSTLATLVVIFGIGEVWIRSQELPEATGSIYLIREDRLPRVVLRPGADEISTGTRVEINSRGFRGREIPHDQPEGTRRIVVLGDSFAFGAGAPVEVIFTTRLEAMLNQTPNRPVEVLNLGVSDYNTEDELAMLQETGLSLSPDLVMLFFVMNDIEVKPEYLPPSPDSGQKKPASPAKQEERSFREPLYAVVHHWRKRSHFLAYLAPRVASLGRALGLKLSSSGEFYSRAFAENVEGWQRSKEALRAIQRLGKEHGFRFALVLFPLMTNFSDSYPARRSHEVIAAFAQDEGIAYLDLLPSYMGKNAQSLWVSPTDGHPNAEGHRIAAEALFRFLTDHPELIDIDGEK